LAYRFAFNYTDSHREELGMYKNAKEFNSSFEITNELYDEFVAFVNSNGVDRKESEIEESTIKLKLLIKAYIGRNILDNEAFYPVFHQMDAIFLKAKDYLTSN
jgi:carboxyl-terminal processing protease